MANISANKQKKIAIAEDLTTKVEKSKGIFLTNYTGLTHQQLEGLKRAVKKLDGEFVIAKNTLLKRALGKKATQEEVFNQPTAVLFTYNDVVEPLKVIAKLIKEINLPVIKAGYLENQWLSASDVNRLSNLPPKPMLQAQLLGMMKQPIQDLHRALNWNIQSLVISLSAIAQKKS